MPEQPVASRWATPESLGRLAEVIQRRTTACAACKAPVVSVRTAAREMVVLDAEPHPKGTFVVLPPGRDGVLRCLELEKLRAAAWGTTAGLEARCRHQRSCGRVIRPWWEKDVRPGRTRPRHREGGRSTPVRMGVEGLWVGDLVLSVVTSVETDSPFRGPATVTAIDGDEVRFGTQVLRVGATGRLTVVRVAGSFRPVELLLRAASLAAVRAAGCVCEPSPVLDRVHGDRPRCVRCGQVAGAPPRPRRSGDARRAAPVVLPAAAPASELVEAEPVALARNQELVETAPVVETAEIGSLARSEDVVATADLVEAEEVIEASEVVEVEEVVEVSEVVASAEPAEPGEIVADAGVLDEVEEVVEVSEVVAAAEPAEAPVVVEAPAGVATAESAEAPVVVEPEEVVQTAALADGSAAAEPEEVAQTAVLADGSAAVEPEEAIGEAVVEGAEAVVEPLAREGSAATGEDGLLRSLADACDALGDMTRRPQPITATAAVAVARRELARDRPDRAIRTRDRLLVELARLGSCVSAPTGGAALEPGERRRRIEALLAAADVALTLVAALAYWGDERTDRWWFGAIERLARRSVGGRPAARSLADLTQAPPLLVMYAGGVAAVAAERWSLVARLLTRPRCPNSGLPVAVAADLDGIGLPRGAKLVNQVLARLFTDHLGWDDATFAEAWERFEYLTLLTSGELAVTGTFLQPYWRTRIRADGNGQPLSEQWFRDTVAGRHEHPLNRVLRQDPVGRRRTSSLFGLADG